jgi:hypothetical protein
MRQANGRFRDARSSQSPERAARLREEGEERLEELAKIDPEAWPWKPWMYAVRDTEFIVPEDGSAFVYEGLRVARPRPGAAGQFDHLEFGRVLTTPNGERIGLRAAGSPTWELVTGLTLTPEHLPREGGPAWPDDEENTAAGIDRKIADTFRYGRGDLETLGWVGAADAWIDHHWPRVRAAITAGFAQSEGEGFLPIVVAGKLALVKSDDLTGELLPPSTAGWQRFLELAPASGAKFGALKETAADWWGRKIPHNLLSGDAANEQPKDAASPPATSLVAPAATVAPRPPEAPSPSPGAASPPTRPRASHFPPGISME